MEPGLVATLVLVRGLAPKLGLVSVFTRQGSERSVMITNIVMTAWTSLTQIRVRGSNNSD